MSIVRPSDIKFNDQQNRRFVDIKPSLINRDNIDYSLSKTLKCTMWNKINQMKNLV